MENPELNVFYPFDGFVMPGRPSTFYTRDLPTEVVVTEPSYVVPRTARVYVLDRWVWSPTGEWITYAQLRERVGKDFSGTAAWEHERLYLCEVWDDDGSDGHMDMRLMGYRYITGDTYVKSVLDATTKGPILGRWHTIPKCFLLEG